jgi:hypothetical protein
VGGLVFIYFWAAGWGPKKLQIFVSRYFGAFSFMGPPPRRPAALYLHCSVTDPTSHSEVLLGFFEYGYPKSAVLDVG